MLRAQKMLADVAAEAARCQRCPLYRNATQTVFGQGPVPAPIMLLGEQPGDSEQQSGARTVEAAHTGWGVLSEGAACPRGVKVRYAALRLTSCRAMSFSVASAFFSCFRVSSRSEVASIMPSWRAQAIRVP